MNKKTISRQEAIKLLKEGADISEYKIVFNQEKVEALQAILLGKNNIEVPEELIYYDDDTIDFSDDPDITDNYLETGKIVWDIKASISVNKELKDWIVKENVDVDRLLTKLIENFYETIKDFSNK